MSAEADRNVQSQAKPPASAAPAPQEQPNQRPYFSVNEPHFLHESGGVEEGRTNALKLGILALLIIVAIAIGLAYVFRAMDKTAGGPRTITERHRTMIESVERAKETREQARKRMNDLHRTMSEAGVAHGHE
ncbi:MAG: hypothetical protein L0Y44_07365 [Phycisphaerales bacterium]|nr:hypothetical protein [Phycisphaerales bacterium]MCI0674614.1 hypothetical protein [Phycisphaerales bacterium]